MNQTAHHPHDDSVARLTRGLEALGLQPTDALDELASLVTLYAQPQAINEVTAHLRLEWLGALDRPLIDTKRLSHRDLLTIIARSTVFDVSTARDVDDVAASTGWSRRHVTRLADDGQLWSYSTGQGERFPSWQFRHEGSGGKVRPIPGLSMVINAIPPDAPPLLVRKVMTTEDAALLTKAGEPMSPADWLAGSRPPWPVIQLVYRYFYGATDLMQGLLLQYEHERLASAVETEGGDTKPTAGDETLGDDQCSDSTPSSR